MSSLLRKFSILLLLIFSAGLALELSEDGARAGGQDGGGASSTQYADKTLEQIKWGFALGIKFSRANFSYYTWDWTPSDIAGVIMKAETSEVSSYRKVNGINRELMMDYQTDGNIYSYNPAIDKVIVRPPMVSMIGLRSAEDMSGTELKRIKMAYLKETAHLMGWGVKADGSNDNEALEKAELIYKELEIDLEICLLPTARDGKNIAYLINPSLGIWTTFQIPISGKKEQDEIYTAAYQALTHMSYAQLLEKTGKSFSTFVLDQAGILGVSADVVSGWPAGEDNSSLSFQIDFNKHTGKIKSALTDGKEIDVACGSIL